MFLPAQRSIGGFTATVTVREVAQDELVITEQPVESGAAISDHAYKRPATVRIEAGWGPNGPNGPQDPKLVYSQLLALQSSRQPFTVVTGKRMYQNMLIKMLEQETDGDSEYVLIVTATCQQIILVNTSVVQSPTLNAANMTMPQQTAPAQNQGTQQAKPTNAFSPSQVAAT
jgi:hypothetical protein